MYLIKNQNDKGGLKLGLTRNIERKSLIFKCVCPNAVLAQYDNYTKLFRFTYLREGNTREKAYKLRAFLEKMGYKNGYVTIDDSDWYIDKTLLEVLKKDSEADLTTLRNFYVNHIFEIALRADSLAQRLTQRNIGHTLLLHHNFSNALFLHALIERFQREGWLLISSSDAFKDPIYSKTPDFTGNGLLYPIAQDREMEKFVFTLDKQFNVYPVVLLNSLRR